MPCFFLICSRAARIGNLQLGLKSSNNAVLFLLRARPDAVSSALDAFRGAVQRGSRDHWLDMKKELNKLVLRQSVMNWVEDFLALGSCGPCTGRDLLLRLHLHRWCTLMSRRSCPNSLPFSWSTAKGIFWLKLFSTVVVPSDFLQKAPMQLSSLLAFAAVCSSIDGGLFRCSPTQCFHRVRICRHHACTIWLTIIIKLILMKRTSVTIKVIHGILNSLPENEAQQHCK